MPYFSPEEKATPPWYALIRELIKRRGEV